MASLTNSEKIMSRSDEVMSSISWTENVKAREDGGDSNTLTSESDNINLSLSLGGFYGENVSKDVKGKKKMYPECPKNWALGSATMDKLKSNCFPLTIRDPSQMITDEKDVEATIKKGKVNQNPTPNLKEIRPNVSTKGNGPYGRKIKGFLFSYNEEKNIHIVCHCHGKIMSPAGFIKHAGGTECENPMKYIKMIPTLSKEKNEQPNI